MVDCGCTRGRVSSSLHCTTPREPPRTRPQCPARVILLGATLVLHLCYDFSPSGLDANDVLQSSENTQDVFDVLSSFVVCF